MRQRSRLTLSLAVLSVLALAGCGGKGSDALPPAAPTKQTVAPKPTPSPFAAKVNAPVGLAVAGGGLWAVSSKDGTVVRIDPATGRVKQKVAVGATPLRAVGDGDTLWVTVFGDGKAVAVNTRTGKVTHTATVPAGAEGVAVGFDSIWVVSQDGKQLTRLDRGGKEIAHVAIAGTPRLVAAGEDAVYVSDYANGALYKVDPAANTETHTARLCDGAQSMVESAGILWVACTSGNEVISVDTRTMKVLGRVPVPGEPDGLRLIDGVVWVACATGPALVAVQATPAAPKVLKTVAFNSGAALADHANVDVESYAGKIWISSFPENGLYSITP